MSDIAAIKAEAAAADAAQAALSAPPPVDVQQPETSAAESPPPVLSPIEEARGVIDLVVEIAAAWFPSLEGIYNEATKNKLARAAAPLMAKYNVSLSSVFAKWKEEIDFAFVAAPLALTTARAVVVELNARKKSADTAQPSPAPSDAPSDAPVAVAA